MNFDIQPKSIDVILNGLRYTVPINPIAEKVAKGAFWNCPNKWNHFSLREAFGLKPCPICEDAWVWE